MDPRYPEILTFLELKKFLGKICSLEQFFTEKSRHSPCSCLKPRSDAQLQSQRFFFNLFSVQENISGTCRVMHNVCRMKNPSRDLSIRSDL